MGRESAGELRWRRMARCAGSKKGGPTVQIGGLKPLPLPLAMEVPDELQSFEATGIYRLEGTGTGAVFLDPVRRLNDSYQRFCVVPSAYYSRSFLPPRLGSDQETEQPEERRKRKRNRKPKPKELNAMEQIAEARHQEARPLLLSAHKSLLKAKNLLEYLSKMVKVEEHTLDVESSSKNNFVELGSSWRAPFYEITVCFRKPHGLGKEEGCFHVQKTSFPLFNSIISVEATDEAEGEFHNRRYILPRGSCFTMTKEKGWTTLKTEVKRKTCSYRLVFHRVMPVAYGRRFVCCMLYLFFLKDPEVIL